MKIFADVRNLGSGEITSEDHAANPEEAAKNVIEEIRGVGHLRGAGHGRAECAYDGDEAGQDHGSAAISFVEFVGPQKVTAPKEKRVFASIERWTCRTANPVSELITNNCAEYAGKEQPRKRDHVLAGEDAGGDQKRIAREKKADKKSRLSKDDGADKGWTAPTDYLFEPFRVVEGAKEVKDGFEHAGS